MPDKLNLIFLPKSQQHSDYDWVNVDRDDIRVGKIRCSIGVKMLKIYSINIFPEFERQGYAHKIIDLCKVRFDIIIADRVRYTAIEFWTKMGFVDNGDGNYIYKKRGP